MIITTRKSLDDKGRCCGRKPLVYKRPPHLFCIRCDAAFARDTGMQIPNWAYYRLDDDRFEAHTTRAMPPSERGSQ
jgi:hypothetical protein